MVEFLKFALPAILAVLAWWMKSVREHNTVGRAICAEILALLDIIEERDFLADLENTEQYFRVNPEAAAVLYHVPVADHYCRVYAGNIQNLGYLEPGQAELIVRFYQMIDSVVRDVSSGGRLAEGTSDPQDYKDTGRILRKAVITARSLMSLRKEQAAEPWWRRYWRALS
ncbi:hypothetical protein L6216_01545 [Pseudomonas syringae pv. syringae]|uniref:hypothetical protein n=1 Tax=Pseudomonas syringae TaxID=317 RepID=UPI001F115B84|nr:hypothetical protein [Pseudomonas syringae]MCH5532854.1 hypothetical protein [Pseudomonas syringae pv. syringae]